MIQHRSLKIAAFTLSLVALLGIAGIAQAPASADTNYDITLQLVIGSNDGAKGDIPQSLGSVVKQIKSEFDFSNYRMGRTFVGRIASAGNFEYNSVTNIDGKDLSSAVPTFLDWSLRDLRSTAGGKGLQAQSFRFGLKMPVLVGDASKGQQAVNYEPIGLGVSRIGLGQNAPTLIGTLHLPGTSGTIFLVMTIRPIDG